MSYSPCSSWLAYCTFPDASPHKAENVNTVLFQSYSQWKDGIQWFFCQGINIRTRSEGKKTLNLSCRKLNRKSVIEIWLELIFMQWILCIYITLTYLRTIVIPVYHETILNVLPILEKMRHLFKAPVLTLISSFLHPPESDTLTFLLVRMEIQHLARPGNTRLKTSGKYIYWRKDHGGLHQ